MEKSKNYDFTKFSVETVRLAMVKLNLSIENGRYIFRNRYFREDETWIFDDEYEFYSAYRTTHNSSYFIKSNGNTSLKIRYIRNASTTVSVETTSRENIHSAFDIFESAYSASKEFQIINPTIFIGHGRSHHWRDLKDHLHDLHNYRVEAYETGARAGRNITNILEDMLKNSSFAIIIMTGEEKGEDILKARQNVIHEIGLFQGRLGFSKTLMLIENNTSDFSNINGIQQIRYSNIKETFGEVLATIKREFFVMR